MLCQFIKFKKKYNLELLLFIFLVIILLIGILTKKINNLSITLYQFITSSGALYTILLLFKRDHKNYKQIQQTKKQIEIQEENRLNQQFLDAIKLINDNKEKNNLGIRLGGLSILKNLAKESSRHRIQILTFLNFYTLKLKKEIHSFIEYTKEKKISYDLNRFLGLEEIEQFYDKKNKFNRHCLNLINFILNLEDSGEINLDSFYFPLMNIKKKKGTRFKHTTRNNNNLIGLNYEGNEKLKNDNLFCFNEYMYINKYDSNRLSNVHENLSNFHLNNFTELELKNASKCFFTNGIIDLYRYNNIICKKINIDIEIKETIFENIVFKSNEKNNCLKKVIFNNCGFIKNVKFTNWDIEEVYFKKIQSNIKDKAYSIPKIKNLNKINILSNDKEKLLNMIEDIKELITKNPELNIPNFENNNLIDTELKELKRYKNKLLNK